MAAIITSNMRVYAAQQFMNGFSDSEKSHYLFIGRCLPWTGTDIDDLHPPMPLDAQRTMLDAFSDMASAKRLNATDVSLVIPRYNWTPGTIYSQYADDVDFFDPSLGIPPFYIVTDALNVYKCLGNANGSASTDRPSHTTLAQGTTPDGYLWKYMYTISAADTIKFLTNEWMPCKTLTEDNGTSQWQIQQASTPGTIDRIDILTAGNQFTAQPDVTITGDCTVQATAQAVVQNGQILRIDVTNAGEGYRTATVSITGGGPGANGASAKAVVSPVLGHGADPVMELGAFYVMLSGRLIYDENGTFSVENDFRRIGLLMNPTQWGSTDVYTGLDMRAYYTIQMGSVSGPGFNSDDIVTTNTGNASAVVLDYNAGTHTVRLVEVHGTFIPGDQILSTSTTGVNAVDSGLIVSALVQVGPTAASVRLPTTANANDDHYNGMSINVGGQIRVITDYIGLTRVASVSANWNNNTAPSASTQYYIANVTPPDSNPYSGQILYVENRRPIIRTDGQSEQISLCTEF